MSKIKKDVVVSMNDSLALGIVTQTELADYMGLKQPTISYRRDIGKTYLKFNIELMGVIESSSPVEYRK